MSSVRRGLARQLVWVLSGKLAAAVLQAFTLLLLARWLGPGGFGWVVTALATVVILQVLIDLGISTFVVRERAQDPDSPHVRRALAVSDRLSLGLSVSLVITAGGFLLAGVAEAAPLVLLAVTAGADRNADCWLGVLLADGDARYNSVILTGRRVVILAVFVSLHASGVDPMWSYCTGTAAASVGASILAHRLVAGRLAPGNAQTVPALFRTTRYYWFHSLFVQARKLDVFVVTALAGAVQAGFYSVASRVTGPIQMLPASMAAVLLPSATSHQRDAQGYRHVIRLSLAVLVASWMLYGCLIVAVPAVLPAVAGDQYADAVVPVQFVIAGLCFASTAATLHALLMARQKSQLVARLSGASTLICLALIAALAPAYGALGAAVALSVSNVASFVMAATAGWRNHILRSLEPTTRFPAADLGQHVKVGGA